MTRLIQEIGEETHTRFKNRCGHSLRLVAAMSLLRDLASVFGVAAALSLSVCSSAFATDGILGDTLTFERLYPDTATPFYDPVPFGAGSSVVTTVVTAGTADVSSWLAPPGRQLVFWNPEANTITFDFQGSSWCGINVFPGCNSTGPGIFDGFRLTDNTKAFASVSYTSTGPMLFQVSLVDGKILVNVDGDGTGAGTDLTLTVTTSVPEPETYAMMLAGLGLLGFVARRRQQKHSQA